MDGRRQVSDSPRDARDARRESRGGIRLTLGGWGHTVSAHWSEPRARATFSRLPITRANAVCLAPARSLRLEQRGATFQGIAPRGLPESPGGLNNEETDSGPACDGVGSDACAGGSSPNGTDAGRVHLCKPVPSAAGALGGILGGYGEDGRSDRGEVDGRRNHPKLVHL